MVDILEDDRYYYHFNTIENYRRFLNKDTETLLFQGEMTTVKSLVKRMELSPYWGQVIFKMVHKYKPKELLEIGTTLGISTLYLATPDARASLIGIGEELAIIPKTQHYFKELGTRNIALFKGSIEKRLAKILPSFSALDFIFVNELDNTSLRYIKDCLAFTNHNSVIVINKPYQNKEGKDCWKKSILLPRVSISIDLYQLGILFFRSEQKEKAHYTLIQRWKKPWAVF